MLSQFARATLWALCCWLHLTVSYSFLAVAACESELVWNTTCYKHVCQRQDVPLWGALVFFLGICLLFQERSFLRKSEPF